MATYKPRPIDTSAVRLGHALGTLVENLSANVHDVWAEKRLADGWHYGPQRDDAAKTHPCLVPYADLPESEKAYDRTMVEQALKSVLALGWPIEN